MGSTSTSCTYQLQKALFLEAHEISCAEKRQAFLRQRCGDDRRLFERLEKLLESVDDDDESDQLDPARFGSLVTARHAIGRHLAAEHQFLEELGTSIRQVGDYELVREIGRGAMGVVFEARQRSLGRRVALKLILGPSLASPSDRQRFRIEAEAAASVCHPNIVPVYEIGHHDGYDFFSMPLFEGGTLTEHLEAYHDDYRKGVALMATVAAAVQAAHERGILHRDMKPDNIVLDEAGTPHVADFGLASRFDEDGGLTLTGQILGTPRYMAPEQAEGGSADVTTAADIYSLGAILYEILAGKPIFKSDSIMETLRMVRDEPPEPLRGTHPHIDRDLETIALKCLEKEPERRYASARDLRHDLVAWLERRPIEARRPSKVERVKMWVKRRPVHAALAVTASLFLVALGVGGPMVAWHQSHLRAEADIQRFEADALRRLAERRALENRGMVYRSNMVRGGLATSTPGTFPSLEPLLERWLPVEGLPDLRSWEWHYLKATSLQATHSCFHEPTEEVLAAFHPLRNTFFTWSFAGLDFKQWDAERGVPLDTIDLDQEAVQLAWHPSGSFFAYSQRRSVTLWDPASKRSIQKRFVSSPSEDQPFPYLAWSADGRQLACATDLKPVFLLDGKTLETMGEVEVLTLNGAELDLPARNWFHFFSIVTWSPDGQYLALAAYPTDATKYVYVKAVHRPHEPTRVLAGHELGVTALAWSPDSRWLVSGSRDRTVKFWDTASWTVQRTIEAHSAHVKAVSFQPDGERIATASKNREVKVWDTRTGQLVEQHLGHRDSVEALAWNHDGKILVSGDASGVFNLWHEDTRKPSHVLYRHTAGIASIALDPSGTRVACLGEDFKLFIVNLETGEPEDLDRFERRPNASTMPILWASEGLIVRREPVGFFLLDPDTGRIRRTVVGTPVGKMNSILSSAADGNMLATTNYRRHTLIHDLSNPGNVRLIFAMRDGSSPYYFLSVALDPTGSYISTTGRDGHLMLWELATGEEKFRRAGDELVSSNMHCHEWHPQGRYFASGSAANHVILWDSLDMERPHLLRGHTSEVRTVTWHPDGNRLASGSWDKVIKIWDTDARELALTLRGHEDIVTSVAWSPDGKRLVSSSHDGTVRVWDASRGYED